MGADGKCTDGCNFFFSFFLGKNNVEIIQSAFKNVAQRIFLTFVRPFFACYLASAIPSAFVMAEKECLLSFHLIKLNDNRQRCNPGPCCITQLHTGEESVM